MSYSPESFANVVYHFDKEKFIEWYTHNKHKNAYEIFNELLSYKVPHLIEEELSILVGSTNIGYFDYNRFKDSKLYNLYIDMVDSTNIERQYDMYTIGYENIFSNMGLYLRGRVRQIHFDICVAYFCPIEYLDLAENILIDGGTIVFDLMQHMIIRYHFNRELNNFKSFYDDDEPSLTKEELEDTYNVVIDVDQELITPRINDSRYGSGHLAPQITLSILDSISRQQFRTEPYKGYIDYCRQKYPSLRFEQKRYSFYDYTYPVPIKTINQQLHIQSDRSTIFDFIVNYVMSLPERFEYIKYKTLSTPKINYLINRFLYDRNLVENYDIMYKKNLARYKPDDIRKFIYDELTKNFEYIEATKVDSSQFSPNSEQLSKGIRNIPSDAINCQDICEKLILTYNASLIDMLGPELREACIKEARECADSPTWRGTEKRNVLAKLIENYIDAKKSPKSTPRYIEGPLNISCHWSQDFQKLICIFGEIHGNQKDCPAGEESESTVSIEDYLNDYFLKPFSFTDFFIEMDSNVDGYKNDEYFGKNSRLNRIRKNFQKCVDSTIRDQYPYCNLSRMHYFDIRRGEVKNGFDTDGTTIIRSVNPMSQFCSDIKAFNKQFTITPNFIFDFSQNFRRLSDFYTSNLGIINVLMNCLTDVDGYIKFFRTEFKNYKILEKEIDRSNTEIMRRLDIFIHLELINLTTFQVEDTDEYQNIVKKTTLEKLKKYTDLFIQGYLSIKRFNDHFEILSKSLSLVNQQQKWLNLFNNIKKYLDEMKKMIVHYNALIIDAYVLARIFKKFNINSEDSRKRRETDEPEEPHNIIIYAGNGHSQVYRKFLTNYLNFEDEGIGGSCLLNNEDIPIQPRYCVDMKNINQPLFSRWPSRPTPSISHSPPSPRRSPSPPRPTPSISHSPPSPRRSPSPPRPTPSISHSPPSPLRSPPPPPRPPPSISHSPPSPQQELPKRSKVLFSFSKKKVDFEPKPL